MYKLYYLTNVFSTVKQKVIFMGLKGFYLKEAWRSRKKSLATGQEVQPPVKQAERIKERSRAWGGRPKYTQLSKIKRKIHKENRLSLDFKK